MQKIQTRYTNSKHIKMKTQGLSEQIKGIPQKKNYFATRTFDSFTII